MHQQLIFTVFIFLFISFNIPNSTFAIEDEICLECHSDPTLTMEKDGKTIQLFVKERNYQASVHGENGCVSCHLDADVEEMPHDSPLEKVECANCHDDIAEKEKASLHGLAMKRGDPYAPGCSECHGSHDILSKSNPKSDTHVLHIPALCGRCHQEGTPMVRKHDIPQKNIIENYSMSIHGEGLFKRGLIVTAVCTNCHTAHNILPHTDPKSTINRENIANTCMVCHAEIENVHLKVIRGELWEKQPNLIPACVDCHSPHKIRRVFYTDTMNDKYCLKCHANHNILRERDGQIDTLFVDINELRKSAHGEQTECIKCHVTVSHAKSPVCLNSGKVDCSICHAEIGEQHNNSIHGKLFAENDPNAPDCVDCHGEHGIKKKDDITSPTFPQNVVSLCGACHRAGEKAAIRMTESRQHNVIRNYEMSIHGKGLNESGLLVTANCTSCHTAHKVLPADDPQSSVNEHNIGATCGECHLGIYNEFSSSIHSPTFYKTDKKQPTCHDCHNAHQVERIDRNSFRQQILDECGTCHEEETGTYFDTYHGKVSLLGSGKVAKCSDCHGAHNVLPPGYPRSTLSRQNIIETCKTCHPQTNRKFTGYLTHATHHDRAKYPFLYYTFWVMTFLLIGTFTFFGLHTLFWIPRSFLNRLKLKKNQQKQSSKYYVRFERKWRVLHIIVIISFFGLAITGMVLKFAGKEWAIFISQLLGGFEVAGLIHRICAVMTFGYFAAHFYFLFKTWRKSGKSLWKFIFDKEGLFPNWNDVKEFFYTLRWFFGRKKEPHYGRWTYWEKFDYLAVFWGVSMIGFTGLILWFPEFFTKFLPGYFINIATIIHSDEALLATGFIFSIHFFNTHFRPDKFPMDPVIFTGKVPVEQFKDERPREYKILKEEKQLESKLDAAPSRNLKLWSYIFGLSCLALGFVLIVLIIWSMVFQYK